MTICLWTIKKSDRWWKTKACWVYKNNIIKWEKAPYYNITRKEFDSKPVYNEKHLKTKIKSYNGNINRNFHNNKIPKQDKNYYPQMFLECRYIVQEKKMSKTFISDDIKLFSDDSYEEDFGKKNSDEENSHEEN